MHWSFYTLIQILQVESLQVLVLSALFLVTAPSAVCMFCKSLWIRASDEGLNETKNVFAKLFLSYPNIQNTGAEKDRVTYAYPKDLWLDPL